MADKKLRFALISHFQKRLALKGSKATINSFAQQWAADALIDSYGYDRCTSAIDYYVRVNQNPDWTWFTYNIDKVIVAEDEAAKDEFLRAQRRKKAKEWLNG